MTPSRWAVRNAALSCRCLVQPSTLVQLDPTDCGVDVGHAVVQPHDLVLVLLLHALVAVEPHEPVELGVATETIPPSPDVMFFVG